MKSLNRAYSRLTMQRRYEAWFLRFGLADGSGAWWFRYLLTNLGRSGCPGIAGGRAGASLGDVVSARRTTGDLHTGVPAGRANSGCACSGSSDGEFISILA